MADDTDNPDDRPVGSPALVRAEPATDDRPRLAPDIPAATPASTPGFFDNISEKISTDLAPLQERRAAAMDKVREQTFGQADRDMATARRAFEATSYSPNDMKSWDQEKESRKFATDPIQAFGSAGSVFAMIASAFTHAPMENALNGAAAAMNAVRAGDEREYERHYKSWKDNTALAIKRHQMEREKYQDAVQLMQTNMGLGRAKMEAVAASFNDQKMLFLARNGLDDEVFKLMQSRASSERTMVESKQKIEEYGFGWALYENDPMSKITEDQEPDPFKRSAYKLHAYQRAFGVKPNTPEAIAIAQYSHDIMSKEHREPTGEELAKFHDKYFGWGARAKTSEAQWIHDMVAKRDAGEISDEEYSKAVLDHMKEFNKKGGAAGGNKELTSERRKNDFAVQERDRLMKPESEGGKGMSFAEATTAGNKAAEQAFPKSVSPNKRDQLQAQVGQYEIADKLLSRSLKTLETHIGAAGVAGRVTRLGERVGNIFGNKHTEREQFFRDINQLQLMSTRLLLDQATGRPLSAEAGKINNIIAGLGPGDVTKNTIDALKNIQDQFRTMEEGVKTRIEGTWKAPETPAAGKPAGGKAAGKQPWERGVLVKPAAPATETAGSPYPPGTP